MVNVIVPWWIYWMRWYLQMIGCISAVYPIYHYDMISRELEFLRPFRYKNKGYFMGLSCLYCRSTSQQNDFLNSYQNTLPLLGNLSSLKHKTVSKVLIFTRFLYWTYNVHTILTLHARRYSISLIEWHPANWCLQVRNEH